MERESTLTEIRVHALKHTKLEGMTVRNNKSFCSCTNRKIIASYKFINYNTRQKYWFSIKLGKYKQLINSTTLRFVLLEKKY